jgi:hypothetical protein
MKNSFINFNNKGLLNLEVNDMDYGKSMLTKYLMSTKYRYDNLVKDLLSIINDCHNNIK